MIKQLFTCALMSGLVLDASAALADSTQTHHCKLVDGSVDMKKNHKECDAVKGEWATDAATPAAKAETKPGTSPAPVAPTASKDVAKPAPATPAKNASKPSVPAGDNIQDHHCRMPDKTIDMKKTHKECDAAKGQWAKDSVTGTTATTQDHHCRMPDKTMDMKKTHKECDAAKGEWAKDADAKATPPAHAP